MGTVETPQQSPGPPNYWSIYTLLGWGYWGHYSAYLTVVYAQNDVHQKLVLRSDSKKLSVQAQKAWILCGDFNSVLSSQDRLGSPVTLAETQGSNMLMDELQLTPLRSKGRHFTWCNKQATSTRVYSKIDWALGNYHWLQSYGNVEADYMNPSVSDHSHIRITWCSHGLLHPRPFRLHKNVMELP